MITAVYTIHIVVSLALIIIVLLQAGKGAEMGAAFGGASKTVFGPRGAAGPMTKITVGAAVIFMLTSIYLTRATRPGAGPSLMDMTPPAATEAPGPAEQPVPGEAPMSLPQIPIPSPGEAPMSPAVPSELPLTPLPGPVSHPAPGPPPEHGP